MSSFDTLLSQLPGWFKDVLEYIAISKAYGVSIDELLEKAGVVKDNFFIQTCDSETLTYWERLLNLPYNAGYSTEYRRQRIMLRLNQTVPYTEWDLRDELTSLFGSDYSLEVNAEESWVKVYVTSDRYGALALLRDVIYKWIPAHLYIYSNQQVTNNIASAGYYACNVGVTFEQVIGTGGN